MGLGALFQFSYEPMIPARMCEVLGSLLSLKSIFETWENVMPGTFERVEEEKEASM